MSHDAEHVSPEIEVHPTTPKQGEQDFWRFAAELVRTALIVSVLAYGLRLLVLEPFVVEGSSMYPRFETNDFLIVDKISYRIGTPQRGDIIVFKPPFDTSVNYIKRVIGLPGETVRIADNKVTIINSANPSGFVLKEPYLSADNYTALPSTQANTEVVVPGNSYYVLGDNRKGSSDSREWGFVPKDNIIGRADIEAWPFDKASIVHQARYSN
jgi:signal peptidase I